MIYYLFGKSSSGKDSIYKRILKDSEGRLCQYVMYTTRPMRSGETEGVQYHFVSEEELWKLEDAGRIVEKRCYQTVQGPWYYFTVADAVLDGKEDVLVIGTLESFVATRDFFGKDRVMPIYIEVEDGERLQRALSRERQQDKPLYREMCRRFLADSEDFSEEKLAAAGIEKRFVNDDLDRCVREIEVFLWR